MKFLPSCCSFLLLGSKYLPKILFLNALNPLQYHIAHHETHRKLPGIKNVVSAVRSHSITARDMTQFSG
jgi:hypothetical protein